MKMFKCSGYSKSIQNIVKLKTFEGSFAAVSLEFNTVF